MTVSFIMPAYKSAFLKEAIESILAQTGDGWELVVVDDCSPDDIRGIVSGFRDPRIRYFRNTENIGGKDLVRQWNHSIGYAEGEWIVLAGDDDIYAPEFVSEVCRLVEKYPQVDMVRARVALVDEKGARMWGEGTFTEMNSKEDFLSGWLTARALTCIGNYAFRKEKLEEIGGFVNFPCGFCSDIAPPIMLSENGVANTSEELFKFRQSAIHLSSDPSRLKDKLNATTQLYKWLQSLDYQAPGYDAKAIHKKCIYDYFNQAIKHVDAGSLPEYLRMCTLAGGWEKMVMTARWLKGRICR